MIASIGQIGKPTGYDEEMVKGLLQMNVDE